jgi:ABC-2 type transport system ATP-binding protein
MRQRLALVLTYVGESVLLILDELTTGLDPEQRRLTWDVVRALADGGTTILLTSHFMDEVDAICDRVAVLVGARVNAIDTPAGLVAKFGGGDRLVVSGGLDRSTAASLRGSD